MVQLLNQIQLTRLVQWVTADRMKLELIKKRHRFLGTSKLRNLNLRLLGRREKALSVAFDFGSGDGKSLTHGVAIVSPNV